MIFFINVAFLYFNLVSCISENLTIETLNGTKQFTAKVAVSDMEKIYGLMFWKSLPKEQGMLFTFDEPMMVSELILF